VDLEGIADPRERRALESQINEFGQCPRQLFGAAHLPRLESPPHKAGIAGGTTGDDLYSYLDPLEGARPTGRSMGGIGYSLPYLHISVALPLQI